MVRQQVFTIIFSVILLPVNFACAFWMMQEACCLAGVTFREFVEQNNHKLTTTGRKRHLMRRQQRLLGEFFRKNSSDPKRSIWLTRTFGFCTLPGMVALLLAEYSAMNPNHWWYVLAGDFILVAINVAFAIGGKIYRKHNPLDAVTAEKLSEKREHSRQKRKKEILVYTLIGMLFLGMLLFFMKGIVSVSQRPSYPSPQRTAVSIQVDLITRLNDMGYETENVPTTYGGLDEHKLEHVAAGVKGDSKFEFYGYSDGETVDLVYHQMVYLTAPEIENTEREDHEAVLPDGDRMFTIEQDGIHYLVMYRNNTVIYAYSPYSLNEINEILTEIGYLESR